MIDIAEMTKKNQDVLNAVTASSETANKALQDIAAETTDFSKKSFEEGTAVAEKLASVKSFDQAMEIQGEYAKSAYEAFIAQSTKVSEMYQNLAKDAFKTFEAPKTTGKAKA